MRRLTRSAPALPRACTTAAWPCCAARTTAESPIFVSFGSAPSARNLRTDLASPATTAPMNAAGDGTMAAAMPEGSHRGGASASAYAPVEP